jgi:hypothetical protein
MYGEIEPLIKEVSPYLMPRATPDFAKLLATPDVAFFTRLLSSTAVATSTAVAMMSEHVGKTIKP